jgi:uncharacterized protein YcbK (DUF882 family)
MKRVDRQPAAPRRDEHRAFAGAIAARPARALAALGCAVVSFAASAPLQGAESALPDLAKAAAALVAPLRGASGKLMAVLRAPGQAFSSARPDAALNARYEPVSGAALHSHDLVAPAAPGVYGLSLERGGARQALEGFRVITLVPFSAKKNGRIGDYVLGTWPNEGRRPAAGYVPPAGFVQVTPANKSVRVSEHFRLQDFLTKDQHDVWPKYVALDTKLLDKLELMIQELKARGHRVEHLQVMSGFRTPRYNANGGITTGRSSVSRHMYGDASDVFVDNDKDGMMDDMDGNGRLDVGDAEVLARAAEEVEKRHPSLLGGVGLYVRSGAPGPYVHVDTRGKRARWRGVAGG